jgi:hypothetical protein
MIIFIRTSLLGMFPQTAANAVEEAKMIELELFQSYGHINVSSGFYSWVLRNVESCLFRSTQAKSR